MRVEHYGYLGAVRDAKDKSRRNIELLERQVAEGVDTPFLHFNLGSEYAAAGDAERALEHFERAGRRFAPTRRRAPTASPRRWPRAVKALRVSGASTTRGRGDEVLALFPGFTDIVLEQALAARAAATPTRRRAARALPGARRRARRYSATVGCGTSLAACALAEVDRDAR